jgi:hypothetical protein
LAAIFEVKNIDGGLRCRRRPSPRRGPGERGRLAQILAANLSTLARREKASLVVLKEFPPCIAILCPVSYPTAIQ